MGYLRYTPVTLLLLSVAAFSLPQNQDSEIDNLPNENVEVNLDDIKISEIDVRANGVDRRWPDGLVYFLMDGTFSFLERAFIRETVGEFGRHTCVKFREVYSQTETADYLYLIRANKCLSHVGQEKGVQTLELTPTCAMSKGKLIHLLMHAIGFYHEHTRPDRNNHVLVEWNQIKPGFAHYFWKNITDTKTLDLPYDYDSIMHFPLYAFAKHSVLPTLIPIKFDSKGEPQYNKKGIKMGQRKDFSPTDIQKVIRMYNCQGRVADTSKPPNSLKN